MTEAATLNGQVIGQAERATRAVLDVLLAELDTPFVNWVSLNLLAVNGEMTVDRLVGELVSGLRIDEAQAAAAIDEIVRAALVSRTDTLRLTSGGEASYQQIRDGIDDISGRLYRGLPREDLITARRVLETLTDRARDELNGR